MSLLFTAVTPHLLVATSRMYVTNVGILHDGPHAALIDPGLHPDEVEDITAALDESSLHADSIVLTHHHWDHVLGASRFPEACVVAQARFTELLQARFEHALRSIGRLDAEAGREPRSFVAPVPAVTVDRILPLMVGGMRVLLVHTPGHAGDHLSIYDAESACLWAGDILSDLEIPFVNDRLDAYERTLAMMAGMDIRILVPGHGHTTSDTDAIQRIIREDRSYLSGLRTRVEAVVLAGGSAQAAVVACADMTFRNPGQNAESHVMNVEQAFLECGGSAPPCPSLGWSREL
jgi:hydroxyacylglutathione hydrolase